VVERPLEKGRLVLHLQGRRKYATPAADECGLLGTALPGPVAHFAQGSAPYGALTRTAEVREGDTVFVTGAAGAVGTLAGQIARLLGAARVIGSTGSPDKARRLERELGYDAVVLRTAAPLGPQLADAAPDGIDIVLDSVGGEQVTAAVQAVTRSARFALVGALDGQLSPHRASGSAPAVLDTYRLLTRGITVAGYNGTDHPDVEADWEARFGHWLRAGAIRFPHTLVHGTEPAPHHAPCACTRPAASALPHRAPPPANAHTPPPTWPASTSSAPSCPWASPWKTSAGAPTSSPGTRRSPATAPPASSAAS